MFAKTLKHLYMAVVLSIISVLVVVLFCAVVILWNKSAFTDHAIEVHSGRISRVEHKVFPRLESENLVVYYYDETGAWHEAYLRPTQPKGNRKLDERKKQRS